MRHAINMSCILTVTVGCCLGAVDQAAGQETEWPEESTRVRVTLLDRGYLQAGPLTPLADTAPSMMGPQRRLADGRLRLQGDLLATTTDEIDLLLLDPPAEFRFRRSDLLLLETFEGQRNLSTPAAIIGGAASGVFGLWLSRALPDDPDTGTTVVMTTGFALPGAALGWLIGRWLRVDLWRTVPGTERGPPRRL